MLSITLLLCAVGIAACGGGGAKVGDCIASPRGTSSINLEPTATVVPCGSSRADSKLIKQVSAGGHAWDVCNTPRYATNPWIGTIRVAGKHFCAQLLRLPQPIPEPKAPRQP